MASGKNYRISIKGVAPGDSTTNSIWEAQTGLSELILKKDHKVGMGKETYLGRVKGRGDEYDQNILSTCMKVWKNYVF